MERVLKLMTLKNVIKIFSIALILILLTGCGNKLSIKISDDKRDFKVTEKTDYIELNYKVKIYDECGNLIEEGYTKNNEYFFNPKKCSVYKLIVINKNLTPYIISVRFIPVNNLCIYFNTQNSYTFYLTDKYYIGLPIERGELNLWPVRIP